MTGQQIGQIVSWLIVAVVGIAIVYWIMNWLYRRSTKETAFVRTGFLGEKVVIDAGAFVWPVIHNITLVNMNTLQLGVERSAENALITRDRMRVDVTADFYVRVRKSAQAVSTAATTLGQRTLRQEQLHDLLMGKFVSALREVAASMDMEDIHERRSDYVARVKEATEAALSENGLELETVAITDIDQTGLEYFNPSNRFDAEGMTKLIEDIETRRKLRNDIEQDTAIQIRSRNLESEKRALEIEMEGELARLQQERDIETRRAEQRAEIAREKAEKDAATRSAEISAEETVERDRINQERSLSELRIAQDLVVRKQELERQKEIEAAEIATRQSIDLERIKQERTVNEAEIAREMKVNRERISAEANTRQAEIARNRTDQEAEIEATRAVEEARIAADRATREAQISSEEALESAEHQARLERERKRVETDLALDQERIEAERTREVQDVAREQAVEAARLDRRKVLEQLEVDRTRMLREAEIAAREEVERARIASERGLDEARITQERDRRSQEISRDEAVETAQLEKTIAVYKKSLDEAAAQIELEAAREQVARAEESVRTTRATTEADRRRAVELTLAQKDADSRKISAEAEKISAGVRAEAQRLINEAENILTDEARQSIFRRKMLEHVEGIIAASVKPMEKINDIKIMQLGGMGDSGSSTGGKNTTDEVIDSALRYRVQAPMIDNLLSEIGIEGGSLAKMGGLIREARDLNTLAKSSEPKSGGDASSKGDK